MTPRPASDQHFRWVFVSPLERTKPAKRRASNYRERKQTVHRTHAGRGAVARMTRG